MPAPVHMNVETWGYVCFHCTSALQDDDIEEGHLEAVLLSLSIAHTPTITFGTATLCRNTCNFCDVAVFAACCGRSPKQCEPGLSEL